MKIRPLQDRIIVKRVDEEETTKGGIIIPDTAKEKPQEGKVIAVGKGKINEDGKLQPLDVKKEEPLKLELTSFLDSVRNRSSPEVDGEDGLKALELAERLITFIREHS